MASRSTHDADARKLAEFLREQLTDQVVWRPEELAAILRHQMDAPVEFDIGSRPPPVAQRIQLLASAQGLLIQSFGALLHHRAPPLSLLRLTKDFARAHLSDPGSPLPRQVAQVLYLGAILAARRRCHARISSQSDEALRQSTRSLLAEPWLDAGTRNLLEDGLEALDPEPQP